MPDDIYVRGSSKADVVVADWNSGNVKFEAKGDPKTSGRFDATIEGELNGCKVIKATEAQCSGVTGDSIVMYGDTGKDYLAVEHFAAAVSVTLLGGAEGDHLNGGDSSDDILVDGPDAGIDILRGNEGDDTLFANAGRDVLNGGPDSDLFVSATVCDGDVIRGGDVSEFEIDNAAWAQLALDPVPNSETDPEIAPSWGVAVVLNKTGEGTMTKRGGTKEEQEECDKEEEGEKVLEGEISGVENLEGSHGTDRLAGGDEPNLLLGRGGNDVLEGNDGEDKLFANNGAKPADIPGATKEQEDDEDEVLDCGDQKDFAKFGPADAGHVKDCETRRKTNVRTQYREDGVGGPPGRGQQQGAVDENVIGGVTDHDFRFLSPVAFFRLDESSGTEVGNWADDEAPGTYKGGVDLGEPGALRESDAAHLDGEDDYLDLTNNWDPWDGVEIEPCGGAFNGYSVEMWVKFDGEASGREELFSRSENGEGTFLYRSPDGRLNFSEISDIEEPVVSTYEPVSSEVWHHVVATMADVEPSCPTFAGGVSNESPEEVENRIALYVDGFPYALELGDRPFHPLFPKHRTSLGRGPKAKALSATT